MSSNACKEFESSETRFPDAPNLEGVLFLKSKINNLKNTLDYWKDKFEKLIFFLHDKLHSWYDKDDKYIDVVNDMYDDNVLDDDDIEELDLNKEKDDFER